MPFICFNLSERLVFMQVFSDFPISSLIIFILLLKNFLSRSQLLANIGILKLGIVFGR